MPRLFFPTFDHSDVSVRRVPRQMLWCARCHVLGYCSKACQSADWTAAGGHKGECRFLPAAIDAFGRDFLGSGGGGGGGGGGDVDGGGGSLTDLLLAARTLRRLHRLPSKDAAAAAAAKVAGGEDDEGAEGGELVEVMSLGTGGQSVSLSPCAEASLGAFAANHPLVAPLLPKGISAAQVTPHAKGKKANQGPQSGSAKAQTWLDTGDRLHRKPPRPQAPLDRCKRRSLR